MSDGTTPATAAGYFRSKLEMLIESDQRIQAEAERRMAKTMLLRREQPMSLDEQRNHDAEEEALLIEEALARARKKRGEQREQELPPVRVKSFAVTAEIAALKQEIESLTPAPEAPAFTPGPAPRSFFFPKTSAFHRKSRTSLTSLEGSRRRSSITSLKMRAPTRTLSVSVQKVSARDSPFGTTKKPLSVAARQQIQKDKYFAMRHQLRHDVVNDVFGPTSLHRGQRLSVALKQAEPTYEPVDIDPVALDYLSLDMSLDDMRMHLSMRGLWTKLKTEQKHVLANEDLFGEEVLSPSMGNVSPRGKKKNPFRGQGRDDDARRISMSEIPTFVIDAPPMTPPSDPLEADEDGTVTPKQSKVLPVETAEHKKSLGDVKSLLEGLSQEINNLQQADAQAAALADARQAALIPEHCFTDTYNKDIAVPDSEVAKKAEAPKLLVDRSRQSPSRERSASHRPITTPQRPMLQTSYADIDAALTIQSTFRRFICARSITKMKAEMEERKRQRDRRIMLQDEIELTIRESEPAADTTVSAVTRTLESELVAKNRRVQQLVNRIHNTTSALNSLQRRLVEQPPSPKEMRRRGLAARMIQGFAKIAKAKSQAASLRRVRSAAIDDNYLLSAVLTIQQFFKSWRRMQGYKMTKAMKDTPGVCSSVSRIQRMYRRHAAARQRQSRISTYKGKLEAVLLEEAALAIQREFRSRRARRRSAGHAAERKVQHAQQVLEQESARTIQTMVRSRLAKSKLEHARAADTDAFGKETAVEAAVIIQLHALRWIARRRRRQASSAVGTNQ